MAIIIGAVLMAIALVGWSMFAVASRADRQMEEWFRDESKG